MVNIAGNSANNYSYLPGDDNGIKLTKYTKLPEDLTPTFAQSVKSITNSQQTLQLLNGIKACIKKLGIDIASSDLNKQSLAEQIKNIEMATMASKRRNADSILSCDDIIHGSERARKSNDRMIYQINESNKPFFRIKHNQVKGYKKNLWHSFKMIVSDDYKRTVQSAEKLVGKPTADNVKQKLLELNQDQKELIASTYNSLLTLSAQRSIHNQLLNQLNILKEKLHNPEAPQPETEEQLSGLSPALAKKIVEKLVDVAHPQTQPHAASASQTAVKQLLQSSESVASAQPARSKTTIASPGAITKMPVKES